MQNSLMARGLGCLKLMQVPPPGYPPFPPAWLLLPGPLQTTASLVSSCSHTPSSGVFRALRAQGLNLTCASQTAFLRALVFCRWS